MEKETKPKPKPKPATTEPAENTEIHKKFEVKVQKIEENICQWIDEETKTLKDTMEKDITSIRSEVDSKNIEINSKVQGSIQVSTVQMYSVYSMGVQCVQMLDTGPQGWTEHEGGGDRREAEQHEPEWQ